MTKYLTALIISAGIFSGIFIGAFIALFHDLPQLNALKQFKPSAVTNIYSSDHQPIAQFYIHQRKPVSIDQIPQELINGLVATEDRQFFSHTGIDLKGILRAIYKDIAAGSYVEGASTITQQLSKTLFLSPEKSILRKIKEMLITFQIERRYTKLQILELYLNQIYLGQGAYGVVEAAAEKFFGKSAVDLSLGESALIAGLPKAPSRYSPLNNPDLAIQRRNLVLKQMAELKMISPEQFQAALNEPLSVAKTNRENIKAPHFIAYLKESLDAVIGLNTVYNQGLTIITTLDSTCQEAAEKAMSEGMEVLEKRMQAANMTKVSPEGALVAFDIESGAIISMVGGRDYHKSAFNRVTSAKRQPGSSFKPFVYATAIRKGYAQNSLILDAPMVFKGSGTTPDWEPGNYSNTFMGEITLRKALALSKNTPAIRLIERLGPDTVINLAREAGISSPLAPNLSLALGTSEISLFELTAAYMVFPNKGNWVKPFGIKSITDKDGHLLYEHLPEKRALLSPVDAAIVTDMLKGVVLEGTGRKAQVLNCEIGGKTGTTDGFKDALFIGFSPETAAGVWVGNDDASTLGTYETGSKAALPIWISFMKSCLKDKPYRFFDIPDNTELKFMDPKTGILSESSDTGTVVKALFKKNQAKDE